MLPRIYLIAQHLKPGVNRGPAYLTLKQPDYDVPDWHRHYIPECKDADAIAVFHPDSAVEGGGTQLWYCESLSSRDGMDFLLFKEPDTTPEQLKACKAAIRRQHDVTSLHVFHITEWVCERTVEGAA